MELLAPLISLLDLTGCDEEEDPTNCTDVDEILGLQGVHVSSVEDVLVVPSLLLLLVVISITGLYTSALLMPLTPPYASFCLHSPQ